LKVPIEIVYFRHSAAAHLCRSRGTLVCHGTQVGKHWVRGSLEFKPPSLKKLLRFLILRGFPLTWGILGFSNRNEFIWFELELYQYNGHARNRADY